MWRGQLKSWLHCSNYTFKNRSFIVAHFSIDNYVGSAEQNIKLLYILKTGQFLKEANKKLPPPFDGKTIF
jgi:hypothetical protein